MNRQTLEKAKEAYITNLQQKQQYYGIDNHDLGQAIKYVTSFYNYLDYLMSQNIEYREGVTLKKGW